VKDPRKRKTMQKTNSQKLELKNRCLKRWWRGGVAVWGEKGTLKRGWDWERKRKGLKGKKKNKRRTLKKKIYQGGPIVEVLESALGRWSTFRYVTGISLSG